MATFDEVFEYSFTKLDPVIGDHIDPPSVAVYETLLNKGRNGAILPGLADRWTHSGDGRVWKLHIRPGARFHSGEPCDARAVTAALELCRWMDGLERQIWYWDPVDAVVPVGEDVVEFRLHHPWPRLPTLLWGTHTAILNVRTRERVGEDFGVTVADGTGPYRLVAWSPERVDAVAVDGPGPATPRRPEALTWHSVPDVEQRTNLLEDPALDVIRALAPTALRDQRHEDWTVDTQDESSQIYLGLGFDSGRGFDDLRLRRGIDAFIDRRAIVGQALDGQGDHRRSPVPRADEFSDVFDESAVVVMPRDEARLVLSAHGFGVSSDGSPSARAVACVVQDTPALRAVAAELSRQLEPVGLAFDFQYVPPFSAFYRELEQQPTAFISKWLWPDAMEDIIGLTRADCMGPGGGNYQRSTTPRVDEAYDRFLEAPDLAAQRRTSARVQELFAEELPYLPLCSPIEVLAVRSRVRGFSLVPGTLYPLYDRLEVVS